MTFEEVYQSIGRLSSIIRALKSQNGVLMRECYLQVYAYDHPNAVVADTNPAFWQEILTGFAEGELSKIRGQIHRWQEVVEGVMTDQIAYAEELVKRGR